MGDCPYCGAPSEEGPPWSPRKGQRLAYDPFKGRLWTVCPKCARWTLTPMEARWETLEACEEAVQTEGKIRATSEHLSLVRVGKGELIRVGEPPRPEFADWRYGDRAGPLRIRRGFWARILGGLPSPPVGGYDPYRGLEGAIRSQPWLGSPFLDRASLLTYLFSQVPLAPECPSCQRPLALEPWEFQDLRFLLEESRPFLRSVCGFCRTDLLIDLVSARPTLRLGLSIVTRTSNLESSVKDLAQEIERIGGPGGYIKQVAGTGTILGEMDELQRVGLIMTLDDLAELEALEAEWRAAEEMAAIIDGELTRVPGFDEFLERLGPESPTGP